MKKSYRIACLILAIAVTFTAVAALAVIHWVAPNENGNGGNLGGDIYPMDYVSLNSFFEDNPVKVEKDEWEYINPYFDKYPRTDNTSNFHSHATAVYDDINGRTVTVDTLYRKFKEALNDPNFSLGLLIYQCIQYKIAHPEEPVEIAFSALRVSASLAVCINPESPYYGYVRALLGNEDYDANGFVRISYLFVEAAKMGIKVNILATKPSYSASQWDPATGTVIPAKDVSEPDYKKYFDKAKNYACYEKYADGKKVSDFLTIREVEWNDTDKASTDIVHVKTCTVTAYRDKYGMDHEYGVWFSSTNLDTADYRGYNANGGSQSGVIISNHPEIYNVSKNFLELTMKYYKMDDIYEFRRVARDRLKDQVEAFQNGTIDQIPYNERIVYLGSETDKVFEVYFTPLGGNIDDWDTTYNPYCKYVQEFYESDNDAGVVFSFNNPNFENNFQISNVLVDALEHKFIANKGTGNRLNLRAKNGVFSNLKKLKAGNNIGFINVKTTHDNVHEKDIIMSYVTDGERRYVSILNSCNFNLGALFYQTNHIIVIKETEETGNTVYTSLGSKESGAIVDDGAGMQFSTDERLVLTDKFSSLPITFEVEFKLDPNGDPTKSHGAILGNNDRWNLSLAYEINGKGQPSIVFGTNIPDPVTGAPIYKGYAAVFKNVRVNTGERLHMAIVTDVENRMAYCYIDGELKDTATIPAEVNLSDDRISVYPFVVGGHHLGSNYNYFRGTVYRLSIWSEMRTAEEVASDAYKLTTFTDETLMAHYEFYGRTPNTWGGDKSTHGNHLETIRLWLDESEVMDVPEDTYCFAVIPDTQILSHYDNVEGSTSTHLANIYNWLLENQEEKRIKYAISVGDITEYSYESEYNRAWEHIQKLSGKIPYSLIMGNHDKYDYKEQGYVSEKMSDFLFNKTFYNDTYLAELDGWYGQRTNDNDVSCSYNAFTVGTTQWLLLNLDFGPTDDMLTWANEVVSAYPDHKVIVATHAYLYRDGSTLDDTECYPASKHNPEFNDGDDIFEKFVKKHENIVLVLSGHDPWDHIVSSQVKGEKGNTITQLMIDGQYMDSYYSRTEMIALLYFSEDGNTMSVRYYSIAKQMYGSVLSQFTISLE